MKDTLLAVFKHSILRRNIIGHLLVLILFCTLAVGNLTWQSKRSGVGDYDRFLQGVAVSVSSALSGLNRPPIESDFAFAFHIVFGVVDFEKNAGVTKIESSKYLVLRVVDRNNRELYRSADAQSIPFDAHKVGFYNLLVEAKNWRIFRYDNGGQNIVEVAQPTDFLDNDLIFAIRQYVFWPLIGFLPLAAIITWLTSVRGLMPLKDLAALIAKRTPNDMSPLKLKTSYLETEPVVQEINGLLKTIETTLVRERAFLADAAHELRTPLAVIQAQAHVLQEADTVSERLTAADELNMGVQRTATLIAQLLTSARLSTQDFSPILYKIDLVPLIQERVATLSLLAEKKSIEMELLAPSQCLVMLDRDSFLSAIDNVIDNAIRYSPNGASIYIQIFNEGTKQVKLTVTDQGSGIPDALHDQVFERFFRVPGTEQQGSGLGLAIVKHVMQLHQGSIALFKGRGNIGLCVELSVIKAIT
jgi:signal transduction histidine kinase